MTGNDLTVHTPVGDKGNEVTTEYGQIGGDECSNPSLINLVGENAALFIQLRDAIIHGTGILEVSTLIDNFPDEFEDYVIVYLLGMKIANDQLNRSLAFTPEQLRDVKYDVLDRFLNQFFVNFHNASVESSSKIHINGQPSISVLDRLRLSLSDGPRISREYEGIQTTPEIYAFLTGYGAGLITYLYEMGYKTSDIVEYVNYEILRLCRQYNFTPESWYFFKKDGGKSSERLAIQPDLSEQDILEEVSMSLLRQPIAAD